MNLIDKFTIKCELKYYWVVMYTNLQYIGHFRDEKLIPKFEEELSKYQILHEIRRNNQEIDFRLPPEQQRPAGADDKYYLFAEREKYPEALKIYQAILGIGRPLEMSEADKEWIKLKDISVGKVGKISVGISVVLFILFKIPHYREFIDMLFIGGAKSGLFAEALGQGQFWRFITPAFLHFSFFHILMNAMWMRELSRILEDHYSRVRFLSYFLIIIFLSNVTQYLMKGPMFGGLSGVVYGLLGLLWVKKTLDDDFPFMLPKRDIYLMIGWFFLCLTGLIGSIANTAHGVGLAVGMIIGLVELVPKIRRQKNSVGIFMKWGAYVFGILFATMLAEVAWSIVNKVPLFYKLHI
jgi:GlpG protein